MRETLDKEIDSMMKMGVIEPSSAAYASPVVMVKKPPSLISARDTGKFLFIRKTETSPHSTVIEVCSDLR